MKLFNWNFQISKIKEPEQETRGLFCDSLMYNMNGGYTTNKAMLLSTVYRCVDVISDAVAQLPLEPYYINDSGYSNFRNTII